MSSISNFVAAKPRRYIKTFTASDAAYAIPSWAQGGNGIAYVSGCAAGASGAINSTASTRGPGGTAGAQCHRVPVYIEAGVTTVSVSIGTAGAAVTASTDTSGNAGGDTTITIGSQVIRLKGGPAPTSSSPGGNAHAQINPLTNVTMPTGATVGPGTSGTAIPHQLEQWLVRGANGGSTLSSDPNRYGAGASGIFGVGGAGLTSAPANGTVGANASGHGAGGAGANCTGPTSTTSGAGTGGLVIIEFVEGN